MSEVFSFEGEFDYLRTTKDDLLVFLNKINYLNIFKSLSS